MSSSTKNLIRDAGNIPAPQYFNENSDAYEVLKGVDGAIYVVVRAAAIVSHTFHNAATTAADGTDLTVNGATTLLIEVYGTSTSRAISFLAAGPSGAFYPISGVLLSTLAVANQTTGIGELWQFDITGLVTFRTDLTAVSGGNVSVKGRAVS